MQVLTDPTAYEQVITNLTSALSTENLLSNFAPLVGVIGGLVVFSFIYRVIRKMIKGAPKGKASI